MRSSDLNVTSPNTWTTLTLDGHLQLSGHRWLFFFLFLSAYLFVLFSDSLVVYVICSQQNLHRPMFVFVAAVLLNSVVGSSAVYPKLLLDLASGFHLIKVSRIACLTQAFVVYSVGSSSFMLLAAMAFDRYLSICRPLHYAVLVSPAMVSVLLLVCWLLPAGLIGGAVLLAARLPLCHSRFGRLYCDIYSFINLSCGGKAAMVLQMYGLLCGAATVLPPVIFVLFSYGRILFICLSSSSRAFSSKALHTCLPHLLVFINYSLSTAVEVFYRRLQTGGTPTASVLTSVLVLVVPTVFNPVVYGLKMKEVFTHIRRLLSCSRVS